MHTYESALNAILSRVSAGRVETKPILDCLGQVLAEDIISQYAIPPFANSAMDGFAVDSRDLQRASPTNPIALPAQGEIAAGADLSAVLKRGAALRIMTGAPIPQGADAVVPIEDVTVSGFAATFSSPVQPGEAIRPAGDDVAAGVILARRGLSVSAAVAGLCAAAGKREIAVYQRPKVAVISTGDELTEPGLPLAPGRIYNSNSFGLAAQTIEAGAIVSYRLHVADSPEAIRDAFTECAGVDLILTSGGVSVGAHDYVKSVFAERGTVDFWRAAIRPGKPIAFGTWGTTLFLGLPGNPVSSFVTFELFARPVIRTLLAHDPPVRTAVHARLAEPAHHEPGRRSFQRAVATLGEGGWQVAPCDRQGSHNLSTLAETNALLVIPEDVSEIAAGETATIMLL